MENRAEQLLELYFSNALNATEALELQTLAADKPDVARELAFQRQLAQALQTRSLADSITNKVWKEAAQYPFPAQTIKVSIWKRYAYAAAAVFALLIAAYLFLAPPSLQTLVADNAKEYPNKMKFKSMGDESLLVPAEVIKAFELYDNGDFEKAAQALQPIVANNPDKLDYRFYWGVSLVKSKHYPEAVDALRPVTSSQDERKTPALYYLGLAYAGAGDKAAARQYLQAYVDAPEGVTYRKQAQAVLQAL